MPSEHHCVGFYGLSATHFDSACYRDLLSWFDRRNCVVDTIGLSPHFRGLRNFKRNKKKIEQIDLATVNTIELNCNAEAGSNEKEDAKLTVILSVPKRILAISSRVDLYARGCETLEMIRPMIRRLRPEYGIGLTRDSYFGPAFYVFGIGSNRQISVDDQENQRGWFNYGREQNVWRQGQIRDVYPWNFLTAPQLNAKIEGNSLQWWIEAKPGRGTLCPVADEMVLWDIREEDIPTIRPILWDAGIIFDYRPLQEERLRNAPPRNDEEVLRWAVGDRKPEEVQVLKVESPGRTRELSTEKVEGITTKKRSGKK